MQPLRKWAQLSAAQPTVYVDFDGTIAPSEPTDQLFDRFADPAWRAIDQAWLNAEITSHEAMATNVSMLRATPESIFEFLRFIPIDPAFPNFVSLCQRAGVKILVVSDGLDLVVNTVLGAAGIALPIVANQLVSRGGNTWSVRFPQHRTDCRMQLGNCKCACRNGRVANVHIMVGDGRSDYCIAEQCNLVFAKGSLLRHCQQNSLPHIAMANFDDGTRSFARWLSQNDDGYSMAPSLNTRDVIANSDRLTNALTNEHV